ncbi:TPA: hypothetical protein ACSC6H_001659 [Klebsiella variicola]
MTKSTITRERLQELAEGQSGFNLRTATHEESQELARMALGAMDSEPVAEVVSIYGDPEAFGEREIRPLVGIQQMPYGTKLYRHAKQEPDVGVYTELYRLRTDVKGPDGFDTWRDAAIAERKARVELEKASQRVVNIDYLGAMAAFHSDQWHKMGPITGYMHGWNACRAAMLQELKKSAGTEATCRSNENVQAVEVQSLTSINPAPDLVSLQKKAESIIGNYPGIPDCWCRTCRPVVLNDMRFVVCPDCGNKRCPRANDHRNACTGSNEPGQEGSAYPDTPQEVKGE